MIKSSAKKKKVKTRYHKLFIANMAKKKLGWANGFINKITKIVRNVFCNFPSVISYSYKQFITSFERFKKSEVFKSIFLLLRILQLLMPVWGFSRFLNKANLSIRNSLFVSNYYNGGTLKIFFIKYASAIYRFTWTFQEGNVRYQLENSQNINTLLKL